MRRMHKESEGEGGSEGGGGGGDDVEAGDAGTGEEVVDRAVGHDGIVEGEAVSLPVGGHLHGGFGARYAQHIAVVGAALEARQGIATVGTRGREKKHLGAAPHDEVAGRHELSAVAEREKESGLTLARFQHCIISLFRQSAAFVTQPLQTADSNNAASQIASQSIDHLKISFPHRPYRSSHSRSTCEIGAYTPSHAFPRNISRLIIEAKRQTRCTTILPSHSCGRP